MFIFYGYICIFSIFSAGKVYWIKLSDLSKMEVLVNVNENDITDVSLNDYALVEVDAYQDRKFKGVVKEVAYAASTSSGGSQQQVTNFQVKVQMLEVALDLLMCCSLV